jgi:ribosomal protein S8E
VEDRMKERKMKIGREERWKNTKIQEQKEIIDQNKTNGHNMT